MYVVQAEKKMDEFKLLEGADAYKADTDRLSRKLNQAKGNLFDDDRRILAEISRNKKEIEVLEKENVSYGEKRRKLSEKYRETLDFLEKILNENKYTTYKYEIYMFNWIFSQTALDAQNFWVQIGVGITARRKMSAKIMPNL